MAFHITDNCIGCMACANICPTGAAQGEKKKMHTIAAEHCIECGTCGRVCPKGAVADSFGIALKGEKKKYWKKPEFNLKTCSGCGICVDVCPVGCITLGLPDKKNKTAYPELIDRNACLSCGFCAQDCPVEAIILLPPPEEDETQAA